ncbi:hypothetical protein LCGC14_2560670 [marine sediment metagenome]|uniref:Uncharacterized protein n=1 Tax=marine sediment metagenome TaxID=412755 RepID=A0A0F9CWC4_9ZZZZ|nr:hypothetical protein [Nitrospirota bacterium]
MVIQQHPDEEVRAAIIRLSDALCSYERNTGRMSVLILREQGGFFYRALGGKPNVPDDFLYEHILGMSD